MQTLNSKFIHGNFLTPYTFTLWSRKSRKRKEKKRKTHRNAWIGEVAREMTEVKLDIDSTKLGVQAST